MTTAMDMNDDGNDFPPSLSPPAIAQDRSGGSKPTLQQLRVQTYILVGARLTTSGLGCVMPATALLPPRSSFLCGGPGWLAGWLKVRRICASALLHINGCCRCRCVAQS